MNNTTSSSSTGMGVHPNWQSGFQELATEDGTDATFGGVQC